MNRPKYAWMTEKELERALATDPGNTEYMAAWVYLRMEKSKQPI